MTGSRKPKSGWQRHGKTKHRYSGQYDNWNEAVARADGPALQEARRAHSRMIERLFGPLDPSFYREAG